MKKLTRDFFQRDAIKLAQCLLGKVLVHDSDDGRTSGVIVETEAYCGPEDRAAHTWNNRRTARTEIVFHDGGFAYVYLVYGMHCCFNVTANVEGRPECVLVRALEPVEGVEIMKSRRKGAGVEKLCSGPGRVCVAMGITRELYGADLCGDELYILEGECFGMKIAASRRIGIDYAGEWRDVLWRFCVEGSGYVSRK